MHQNTIRWWNCCASYEFNLIMFGCLLGVGFNVVISPRCHAEVHCLTPRKRSFDPWWATSQWLKGTTRTVQWLSIGKGGGMMWRSMDTIELQCSCKGYRILRRDFVIVFLWRMWGFCCWLETNHFWETLFFLGSTTRVWLMRLAGIKVLWWSKVSQPDSCPRRWPVWNGLCRGSCSSYFFSSVVYTISQEISYMTWYNIEYNGIWYDMIWYDVIGMIWSDITAYDIIHIYTNIMLYDDQSSFHRAFFFQFASGCQLPAYPRRSDEFQYSQEHCSSRGGCSWDGWMLW